MQRHDTVTTGGCSQMCHIILRLIAMKVVPQDITALADSGVHRLVDSVQNFQVQMYKTVAQERFRFQHFRIVFLFVAFNSLP